jgi:type II secretory pathway pseudopilin PulG
MLTRASSCPRGLCRSQRGLSIVEMLVGITIGLFVVAAAALMVSSQLAENRKLLIETQLQQDLRATMEIMTRELRRASYRNELSIWRDGVSTVSANTYGAITPSSGVGISDIEFDYRRRSGDDYGAGFKLEGNVIKSRVSDQWETMTDEKVMRVTSFTIDLAAPISYPLPCPKLCAGGTQTCWPEVQLRTATLNLTGQSATDPSVVRTLRTQVRLRNDWVRFNGAQVCPS